MTARAASAVLACALLLGCGAAPPRFFTLRSLADEGMTSPPAGGVRSLGIGPVTIPDYLQRSQMVYRVGPTELRFVDGARWGEPLGDGIARTLATNLQLLTGAQQVLRWPWDPRFPPERAVSVDVLRFERQAGPAVELLARWTVRAGGTVAAPLQETRLREPAAGDDPAAAADALARALAALSREIAPALVAR